MCVCVICIPGAHRGQKIPLELELQMVVSCHLSAGIECNLTGSSGRAIDQSSNCRAISSAQVLVFHGQSTHPQGDIE